MDGKWEEEEGGRRVGREGEGKLSKVGAMQSDMLQRSCTYHMPSVPQSVTSTLGMRCVEVYVRNRHRQRVVMRL